MYYVENLYDVSFRSSLNWFSSFVAVIMVAEVYVVPKVRVSISLVSEVKITISLAMFSSKLSIDAFVIVLRSV